MFYKLLLAVVLTTGTTFAQQKFYPDDPLTEDSDHLGVPVKPATIELSDLYDRFSNIFHDFGSPAAAEAENVNTLDEVPDSTWFTNRHGRRRMTTEELVRGPNSPDGGSPVFPWTILKGKSEGVTPGFQIEDARGRRYLIKLDGKGHLGLKSSTEVICTKLFYAFGYNVPENYVVDFHPEDLRIKKGAQIRDRFGDKIQLTRKRLEQLLETAARAGNGGIRGLASQYIEGEPLGPFRYYGTRSDDPNDIIPHENRRELRGLRVIAAWLNHDDTRAQNTLDTWVSEGGKHFVRHYLIDFGSALGSGSEDLDVPNTGYYWMDFDSMKKAALGFGFFTPVYRRIRWPAATALPAVGRLESAVFEPDEWRGEYPNPAFVRMTNRDAFWAAKIIMRFTSDELLSILSTGNLEDSRAERYLLQTLEERQFKVGRTYLNRINPLDKFSLKGNRIQFVNLSETYGVGQRGATYHMQWSIYDDVSGRSTPIGGVISQTGTAVSVPVMPREAGKYLRLEIRSEHSQHPDWSKAIRVYLRSDEGSYRIVGIERET